MTTSILNVAKNCSNRPLHPANATEAAAKQAELEFDAALNAMFPGGGLAHV